MHCTSVHWPRTSCDEQRIDGMSLEVPRFVLASSRYARQLCHVALTGGPNRSRPFGGALVPLNRSGRFKGQMIVSVMHSFAWSSPAARTVHSEQEVHWHTNMHHPEHPEGGAPISGCSVAQRMLLAEEHCPLGLTDIVPCDARVPRQNLVANLGHELWLDVPQPLRKLPILVHQLLQALTTQHNKSRRLSQSPFQVLC